VIHTEEVEDFLLAAYNCIVPVWRSRRSLSLSLIVAGERRSGWLDDRWCVGSVLAASNCVLATLELVDILFASLSLFSPCPWRNGARERERERGNASERSAFLCLPNNPVQGGGNRARIIVNLRPAGRHLLIVEI